jgi:Holliday junction resolvase RusA-like endonuclease
VELEFAVPGQPVPQGSKNAYNQGGRIVLVESAKGLKKWRKLISDEAARNSHKWTMPDSSVAIHVSITFFMERPRSVKRLHPTVKPDLDKLVRGVLDGVTQSGKVWKDDSQVTVIVASKVYASGIPLTIVSVRT